MNRNPPRLFEVPIEQQAYTAKQVAAITGLSYRQVDWWTRKQIITPTIRQGTGSGSNQRLYSYSDLHTYTVMAQLIRLGCTLSHLKPIIDLIRSTQACTPDQVLVYDKTDGWRIITTNELAEITPSGYATITLLPYRLGRSLNNKLTANKPTS